MQLVVPQAIKKLTMSHGVKPFPNLEEFDSMIVDLTSLPTKDLLTSTPNNIASIVSENFQRLIKAERTFLAQNRDTFCIIADQNPQIGKMGSLITVGYLITKNLLYQKHSLVRRRLLYMTNVLQVTLT